MANDTNPVVKTRSRTNTTARLCECLRRRIQDGEWSTGERLPSEPDLARQMNASRGSLRDALTTLEGEGLLSRRHGSGTYVAPRRQLVNSLHVNKSADQMISETGRTAGTSQLSWQRRAAGPDVSRRLGLPEGVEVFELFRVRTADGNPVTVSYDYVAVDTIPGQPALLGPSYYSFLSKVCGVEITYGVAELCPVQAEAEIAEHLGVPEGTLCLLLRQVDFDTHNQPKSLSVEYHLASAFHFELLRRGPGGAGAAHWFGGSISDG